MKNNKRNPFVALCEYASMNDWCWKLVCTTCGHSAFRVSFSKIINGLHPDDESFWPYGKENYAPLKEVEEYSDFSADYKSKKNEEQQLRLAKIIAEAKLFDIEAVAKFPDWLGYIGIALHHCQNLDAKKIISDSFLPQFIGLLKKDKEICEYLQNKQAKQELLNIKDLERIEGSIDMADNAK